MPRQHRTGSLASLLSLGACLALACCLLDVPRAHAQSRPNARTLSIQGRNAYTTNEYELAAKHFEAVQRELEANQKALTPQERKDFEAFVGLNNNALNERQQGAANLRNAWGLFRQGKKDDARNIARPLLTNQFLTMEDRQSLAQLWRLLDDPPPTAKADPKGLLRNGRNAFSCGDLDTAEDFAHQAEKCWSTLPNLFSWDTPTKLLRDIQAERVRRQNLTVRPVEVPPVPEKKEGFFSMKPFKNFLFRYKDSPGDLPKIEDKSAPLPNIKDRPGTNDGPTLPTAEPTSRPLPKTSELREQGSPFNSMKSFFSWPLNKDRDDSKLRSQLPGGMILRLSSHDLPAPPPAPPGVPTATNLPAPPGLPAAPIPTQVPPGPGVTPTAYPANTDQSPAAQARQLVKDGFKALEMNDLETARRFGQAAKDAKVPFRWTEPNPDRLLAEVARRENALSKGPAPAAPAVPPKAGDPAAPNLPPPMPPTTDPRLMLRQARVLLDQGQFDEAEKLIAHAAVLKAKGYSLFEESPDRLRADLKKARGRSERDQSVQVLAEGRKQLALGNLEQAKSLAFQAQKLHGPYSVWDFGDRPQRLLDDIGRAELTQKREPKTAEHTVALNPNAAQRTQAAALMGEARDLAVRGLLVEARQKAMEARSLRVPFSPQEENPDNILANLNGLCGQRLNLMLAQSWEMMNNPTDPARFQKAAIQLAAAKELCVAFGFDVQPIEQRIQLAQAQGTDTQHQTRKIQPHQMRGMETLDRARLELKSGNTVMARRLAEEAFNQGVQEEAVQVLRSIDAEEFNQTVLAANRTATAGIEAFRNRDYRTAAGIFAALDMKRIAPQYRDQIREILSTREMQPEIVGHKLQPVPTGNAGTTFAHESTKPLGKATVSDLPKNENLTENVRVMEKIQFDRLREMGLAAQRSAMEQFKNEPDRSVEILTDYLKNLEKHQTLLDANQLGTLQAPVQQRLHQYKTILAQREFEKQQLAASGPKHNENARNRAIKKTQDEVEENINRFRALRKEGKFEEALAAAQKAKELDPDNLAADVALHQIKILIAERDHYADKASNEAGRMAALRNEFFPKGMNKDNINGMVFDREIMKRWEKREDSGKGILLNGRSGKSKELEQKLESNVSLNFKDTPLQQVVADLQSITGANVILQNGALQEAGIRPETPLSLKVENVSLKSALNILLQDLKLTYVIKDEAFQITTQQHAKGKTQQKVYNVADLVVPVENHHLPTVQNLNEMLSRNLPNATNGGINSTPPSPYTPQFALPQGQPIGTSQSTLGGAVAQQQAVPNVATAQMTAANLPNLLIHLITNSIAQDSWKDVGGEGSIQYFPLGLALVVNQTQEVQEEIVALLAALRRLQDLQVAVEMRLVAVSESYFERMGMDFDVNIRTPTSTREPQLLTGQFTPFGFVNRNLDRLGLVSGLTPAGTLTPDLNVPLRNSSFDFSIPPFGGYPGTLGADGGLSLGLAFLSDIQVFMFLEAAQGDRRANVMQAPKITVFNGQTATISVQDQMFFLTNISLQQAGAQLFFLPTNIPLPIGLNLTVTPVVSADRRFVRMSLAPQMTNLISANVPMIPVQIPVPNILEGPGAGTTQTGQPVIFQMFFQQPGFSSIQVDTTVNVPDGGTVVLGGMKTLAEARNEFGPPVLSKIPYLNRLFKNVAWGREAHTLMIMVTPRIIIREEEEAIYLGQIPPIPRP